MKTTAQLNAMYCANQSKALKAKLRNVTRHNMKGLIENLLMAMDKLDIEVMLSDICDNDTLLTATLYEKRIALGNIISSLIDTQN